MPRNGSGSYTRAISAFAPNTTISSTEANTEAVDLGAEITNSLPRDGQAGMLAPLRGVDGTVSFPMFSFSSENSLGLLRSSAGVLGVAIAGALKYSFSATALTLPGNCTSPLQAAPKQYVDAVAGTGVPTGATVMYGGATAPSGWLLCDGAAVSRATYAALFAAIGVAFGAGDGSTTFNVPKMNGRSPIGVGQGNTALGGGLGTARTLGTVAGTETVALTTAQLAAHSHSNTLSDPGHTHPASTNGVPVANAGGGWAYRPVGAGGEITTGSSSTGIAIHNVSAGSDQAHDNMGPVIGFNFIIKT